MSGGFVYVDATGDAGELSEIEATNVIEAMHTIGCDGVIALMARELASNLPCSRDRVVPMLQEFVHKLRSIT